MPDLQSRPFHPDPEQCCEACAFGRGKHAEWCRFGQVCIEAVTSLVPGIQAFAVSRPLPDGSREIVEWQYFSSAD